MSELVDLDRYPLDRLVTAEHDALLGRCRDELERSGACDLVGFLRPEAAALAAQQVRPIVDGDSYLHARDHNVWFLPPDEVPGARPGDRSLAEVRTVNRTVCADQLVGTVVEAVYEWEPLRRFVAALVGLDELHLMADPLARLNVMSYRDGESLGWHFDRAAFTTTLLLQQPEAGGEFEFRRGLRRPARAGADEIDADEFDHEGIGALVAGEDPSVEHRAIEAGTLGIFVGHDTVHRVAPVRGDVDRLMAVFSYVDRPGVVFSGDERRGFYGRA